MKVPAVHHTNLCSHVTEEADFSSTSVSPSTLYSGRLFLLDLDLTLHQDRDALESITCRSVFRLISSELQEENAELNRRLNECSERDGETPAQQGENTLLLNPCTDSVRPVAVPPHTRHSALLHQNIQSIVNRLILTRPLEGSWQTSGETSDRLLRMFRPARLFLVLDHYHLPEEGAGNSQFNRFMISYSKITIHPQLVLLFTLRSPEAQKPPAGVRSGQTPTSARSPEAEEGT